jgi:hypothetical protein
MAGGLTKGRFCAILKARHSRANTPKGARVQPETVDSGYRPFVISAVRFFFRHPVLTTPAVIVALGVRAVLPAKAIQLMLFRERTPETLRISRNIKTHIHVGL